MSDLLSPLLVTMMDEAHAYVCFCALMQRLKKNFMVDGQAMTKMFQHLSEGRVFKFHFKRCRDFLSLGHDLRDLISKTGQITA